MSYFHRCFGDVDFKKRSSTTPVNMFYEMVRVINVYNNNYWLLSTLTVSYKNIMTSHMYFQCLGFFWLFTVNVSEEEGFFPFRWGLGGGEK